MWRSGLFASHDSIVYSIASCMCILVQLPGWVTPADWSTTGHSCLSISADPWSHWPRVLRLQTQTRAHSCWLLSRQLTRPPPTTAVYLSADRVRPRDLRQAVTSRLVDCYGGRKWQQLVHCPAAVGASVERAQRRRCARQLFTTGHRAVQAPCWA